ncbi:PilN domain-containing protein [Orenia marismortui]|uniref:Type IV pilus assembly protein PilN n=1 Tax=Orenia marismortui TaxID=46469 RepID=A0A4R8GJ75_9FIRM|nr:hypothetical protein [Orenia marismortui]TDX45405.1 hypothetical protein C7959_1458 [Orenia marismortui]
MNLIPKEYRLRIKYKEYRKRSIMVSLFLSLLLIGVVIYYQYSILDYQRSVITLNTKLESLSQEMAKAEFLKDQKRDIDRKKSIISKLSNRVSYLQILEDLNLLVPENTFLEQFVINRDQSLEIIARTTNDHKAINILNRLEKYPYFKNLKMNFTDSQVNNLIFGIKGSVGL